MKRLTHADSRPASAPVPGLRRTALTLLILALLTFFLGLGRQAVTDSDEGFYAEAAREMVESGDWLTPHFNYAQRWEKPVLYYWLSAATFTVFGPSEGAARFWSALSGVGLALLTWLAARRLDEGDERTAFVAGSIVATCFGYYAIARLALPDLPLTLFISATIWAVLRAVDGDGGSAFGRTRPTCVSPTYVGRVPRSGPGEGADAHVGPVPRSGPGVQGDAIHWWMGAGLAAGLGFLTKGPVAIVVPAVVLLPLWWRERRALRVSLRGVLVATLVAAIIGLPWYVAMVAEHGTAYIRSFFFSDNLERFATATYNEPRPFWFYVPIVVGGLIPWSAYLIALPLRPALDVLARRRGLTRDEWRLLAWALMPLLFYTASIGKQPRYVLPVLPPLSILLARSLVARIDGAASAKATSLRVATWLTATLFALLTILLVRAQPLFINAYPAITWLGVGALTGSATALAWIAATGRWTYLPSAMPACATLLLLTTQFGALAGVRPEPVERMAALVAAHRTAGQPVGEYQVFVRNLVFYAGFAQTRLDDEAAAVRFIASDQPVLLVVRERDLARLESGAARTMRRLGQVRYVNTANLKVGTLLWPDPARDVDNVLLVTNR